MKPLVLGLSLLAAIVHAEMLPAADTPSKFRAECTVSLLGHATFQSLCTVEDMSAPLQGFNNRFRLVVANAEGVLPMARIADYVSAGATANGHMQVAAVLAGFVDVRPLDAAIRFRFTSSAPAYEVRPQNMTMSYLPGGALEILVEEPWADFNGKEPSVDWLSRNRDAQILRCHAH